MSRCYVLMLLLSGCTANTNAYDQCARRSMFFACLETIDRQIDDAVINACANAARDISVREVSEIEIECLP